MTHLGGVKERLLLLAAKNDEGNFIHWAWLTHCYLGLKGTDPSIETLMAAKSRGLTDEYDAQIERELS